MWTLEQNAPNSHRRALRYTVECARGRVIGQPGAVWLVSDSFKAQNSGLTVAGQRRVRANLFN